MNGYSSGVKGAAVVIHQLCFILTICSLYEAGFMLRMRRDASLGGISMLTIIGLVGSFVLLAYLTSIAGRRSETDTQIHFGLVDHIYTDVQLVLFVALIYLIGSAVRRIQIMRLALPGLLVAVGIVGYLADAVFLLFYLSMVRRSKDGTLVTHSLCYQVYCFFRNAVEKRNPRLGTQKGRERYEIQCALESIAAGALETHLDEARFHGPERQLAVTVNHIRDGLNEAVLEKVRNEKLKAELITNVSHDFKTPLTSIVNYVDLLKRENLGSEKAQGYIRILDEKSQRLKQLAEDLVEVSRISSGNIELDIQRIDLVELICQTGGEFTEYFESRGLTVVTRLPQQTVMVEADGRRLYRAIGNLYVNAAKYALEKTRVFVELKAADGRAVFSIKNISSHPLPAEASEVDLTERFVRGEVPGSMEGSGLGLSIARSLTNLMGGDFAIKLDGDLFVATIVLNCAENS